MRATFNFTVLGKHAQNRAVPCRTDHCLFVFIYWFGLQGRAQVSCLMKRPVRFKPNNLLDGISSSILISFHLISILISSVKTACTSACTSAGSWRTPHHCSAAGHEITTTSYKCATGPRIFVQSCRAYVPEGTKLMSNLETCVTSRNPS